MAPRPRLIALSLLSCLLVALVSARAHAQLVIQSPVENYDHVAGFDDAKRRHRFAVVFLRGEGDAFATMDERTWKNPTLAAWFHCYAVGMTIDSRDHPVLFRQFVQQMRQMARGAGAPLKDPATHPYILVFRDGELVGSIPDVVMQSYRYNSALKIPGLDMDADANRFFPKPLEVLLQLDHLRERSRAQSPVWFAQHERKNPMPEAPVRRFLHDAADENAPAYAGPLLREDVFSVLERAQAQVLAGELFEATGTYTWLWERMLEGHTWLRPVRAYVVSGEIRALCDQRTASLTRFQAVRDAEAEQFWWADFSGVLDCMLANEIVSVDHLNLELIDQQLNDIDEAGINPRPDTWSYDLLCERAPWMDAGEIPANPEGWIKQLRAARNRTAPKEADGRVDQVSLEDYRGLCDRLVFDESVRLHAALLGARRETEAMRIAADLIARDTTGDARMALAAMAWATGNLRPCHTQWAREARGLGLDDAGLLLRLAPDQDP